LNRLDSVDSSISREGWWKAADAVDCARRLPLQK
jgi:hypothetical protein